MKKGYITLELQKESNDLVLDWLGSASIKLLHPNRELHVTLFFGIDPEKAEIEEVLSEIKNINLKQVSVKRLTSFAVDKTEYNVICLELEDSLGLLKSLHERFLSIPHIEDANTNNFIPHITLGYSKNNFNSIRYNGPTNISLQDPQYKIKPFEA